MLAFLLALSLAFACDKVTVEGMTCQSCVSKIQEAFNKHPEVESVKVDLKSGSVDLHYKKDRKLTPEQVRKTVEDTGYRLKASEAH
jgi:copper chaperone CopZ